IVTTASYTPIASALGSTESARFAPPVPAAGETASQDEFVVAVQDRLDPVALATEIVCDAGNGVPIFQTNRPCVLETAIEAPGEDEINSMDSIATFTLVEPEIVNRSRLMIPRHPALSASVS